MTALDAHLVELPDDKRQVLETWLVEFDLSWDESRLAWWVRRLPPLGDCLRRPALLEMIKIDLERRWQRGQRAHLEAYLKVLPELGAPDQLPADLLLAEYEARQQCGPPVDLAEFARRFPRQAAELRRLVGQARVEPAQATRRPSEQTSRPSDQASNARGCPSPSLPVARPAGSVAPDFPAPIPGQPGWGAPVPERLGRYHILRELGRGAMGTVYLAHDGQLDRPVALKVPRFTAADGPEVRQRFFNEARAAATIEHPNVCPVYDVGEIDGTPYLTMAYLQGQPLTQFLEGPKLSERQAAFLVRQLTAALQAAHERGIIHRDLKPSNIMINQRGEPILLDFGLARRLHPEVRLTQSGQPLGTPAYMSPEQVAGAIHQIGPGCDVYALGVILYQLLAGRLPFEGSVAEVLGQIVTQPPEPPSKHRPGLDPRLEVVCLKALSKKVADRYASMRDLGAALADYLCSDPLPVAMGIDPGSPPAPVVGPEDRPRPASLGRKLLWRMVAAGFAAGVLLASLLWISNSPGTLRIELDGPRAEVEVIVDGERIEIPGVNEPLQLRPGKHHLLVTGKKIQPVSLSFTVTRGDNPILRVSLVPSPDAAEKVPTPSNPRRRHEREREREEPDDD